jgi:hypothetical protein
MNSHTGTARTLAPIFLSFIAARRAAVETPAISCPSHIPYSSAFRTKSTENYELPYI